MDSPTMDKSDIVDTNKGGGHFIHDPIHSDTDPKDETGVIGMDTNSIVYINFTHFSSISHLPIMTCRHGH